jgi:hypothetical protein
VLAQLRRQLGNSDRQLPEALSPACTQGHHQLEGDTSGEPTSLDRRLGHHVARCRSLVTEVSQEVGVQSPEVSSQLVTALARGAKKKLIPWELYV